MQLQPKDMLGLAQSLECPASIAFCIGDHMPEQPVEQIDPHLVYVMSGMNRVPVQNDIVYEIFENTALRDDVYRV